MVRLELRARGGDAPIWRVEVPARRSTATRPETPASTSPWRRAQFNELAEEGTLTDWVDAYEHGHVRVTGDAAVTRLLGNVIQRQLARA